MNSAGLLSVVAVLLSGASGALVAASVARRVARRGSRARARAPDVPAANHLGWDTAWCLRRMVTISRCLAARTMKPIASKRLFSGARGRFANTVSAVGSSVEVGEDAYVETMLRFAFAGAAVCGLLGCTISNELALLGLVVGAFWGLTLPRRTLAALAEARSLALEKGMSEMLEVIALGVRSGLSFDRSLELYTSHFDSMLARECAAAQRAWSFGLATREEALKALAASYDSPLFARTMSSVVRSLRFGTALGECLEQAAAQARAERRARVEERVAKAPVKMMIPTGTLILPAMLIMVLGPVLLELMGGI